MERSTSKKCSTCGYGGTRSATNYLRSYLRGCALVVIIEKFGTGFPDDIHKLFSRVSASESVGVAPPARAGRWKGETATRGGTENGFRVQPRRRAQSRRAPLIWNSCRGRAPDPVDGGRVSPARGANPRARPPPAPRPRPTARPGAVPLCDSARVATSSSPSLYRACCCT